MYTVQDLKTTHVPRQGADSLVVPMRDLYKERDLNTGDSRRHRSTKHKNVSSESKGVSSDWGQYHSPHGGHGV